MPRLGYILPAVLLLLVGCATPPPEAPPPPETPPPSEAPPSHAAAFPGALPGSVPGSPTPAAQARANTDPTAIRLHALAGDLLLYEARHRRMPASLNEVSPLTPVRPQSSPSWHPPLDTIDPASGQPFVYIPGGRKIHGIAGRLIVYQPVSVKSMRWALFIDHTTPDQAVTYIVHIADKRLR